MKTVNAVLVEPSGIASRVTFSSLEEAQAHVGGNIEGLSLPGAYAYINEDGKGLKLPLNVRATDFWIALLAGANRDSFSDFIVGNMLIFGPIDSEGDETDVPLFVLEHFGLDWSTRHEAALPS